MVENLQPTGSHMAGYIPVLEASLHSPRSSLASFARTPRTDPFYAISALSLFVQHQDVCIQQVVQQIKAAIPSTGGRGTGFNTAYDRCGPG